MRQAIRLDQIPSGRYIIGVSGGVDSMVLLDLLLQQSQCELVVAHFDHGIREDSASDRECVQQFAMSHNIKFVCEQGRLGTGASEEEARRARYDFLRRCQKRFNARSIFLAHHKDDLIETAIINLLRGTGWRGLNALRSHDAILRPLLTVAKSEILAHAQARHLQWRDDPSNIDPKYLRNFVRHTIIAQADKRAIEKLYSIIVRHSVIAEAMVDELNQLINRYAVQASSSTTLPRYPLIMWPATVTYEFLQEVLRQQTGNTVERKLGESALLFVKTAKPGKRLELGRRWQLRATNREVIVESREDMLSY